MAKLQMMSAGVTVAGLAVHMSLCSIAQAGIAELLFWDSPFGGVFGDADNWSDDAGPPTPIDTATFDLPNTYFVDFDSDAMLDTLVHRRGTPNFDFADLFALTADDLLVGTTHLDETSILRLLSGDLYTNEASIGDEADTLGIVHVFIGMDWYAGDLVVGDNGEGEMLVNGGSEEPFVPGGFVESETGIIGHNATGVGRVFLVNGSWMIVGEDDVKLANARGKFPKQPEYGPLTVGNFGDGFLSVGPGDMTNGNAFVGREVGGVGFVEVDGQGGVWTNFGDVIVGLAGQGQVDVFDAGHFIANVVTFGQLGGSEGIGTVAGQFESETSHLEAIDYITVGRSGFGSLTIEDHGRVTTDFVHVGESAGGPPSKEVIGEIIVSGGVVSEDGLGPSLLEVGTQSAGTIRLGIDQPGTLVVEDGGLVTSGFGAIGITDDGQGSATVTGDQSVWAIDNNLTVGVTGVGELSVLEGGLVSVENCIFGAVFFGNGSGFVDSDGSHLQCSSLLEVGTSGTGELEIMNAGLVTCDTGFVGHTTNPGTIDIGGPDSTGCSILDAATAMVIRPTGTVTVDEAGVLTVGVADPDALCDESMLGKKVEPEAVTGNVQIGEDEPLKLAGGEQPILIIHAGVIDKGLGGAKTSSGGTLIAGRVDVAYTGILSGGGTIIVDEVVENDGLVSPDAPESDGVVPAGETAGTLTIEGDYNQSKVGVLMIEVGGRFDDESDRLDVEGTACLKGTLLVSNLDDFELEAEDEIVIVSADAIEGHFDAVILPPFEGADTRLAIRYSDTAVTVVVSHLADLDDDGDVGASDLPILLGAWGEAMCDPLALQADVNGDDIIDASDLAQLLGAWGPCSDLCCIEDINDDGAVDPTDLAELLAQWDTTVGPCPDLNRDGIVGPNDLALLLGLWGLPNDDPKDPKGPR